MKKNIFNKNWLIILISSFIVGIILWNTYVFVNNFKIEERNKMELWSLATLELIDIEGEISNLTLEVLKKNKTTPMIKVDNNGAIEINNIEPPILDGSSRLFVDQILSVGIKELSELKKYIKIIKPIVYENKDNGVKIEIHPSNNLSIQYDADFRFGGIGQQSYTFDLVNDYIDQISSSRTFCSLNELIILKEKGLIKGGSVDNALIFLDENQSKDEIVQVGKVFDCDVNLNYKTLVLNDKKLSSL